MTRRLSPQELYVHHIGLWLLPAMLPFFTLIQESALAMSQFSPALGLPVNDILSSETIATETRQQRLTRLELATPRFLQGVYPFAGRGFFDVGPLNDALCYVVPAGAKAEIIYVRAGNLSDDLIYLALCVNGLPIRYFPVGPKADFHVPLSITETHPAGAKIEVGLAAPRGLNGAVVVDVGILEEGIDA